MKEKRSDLMGPSPFSGETPQAQEDMAQRYPSPGNLSELQMTMEPEEKEYRWFYGNGQLHVSPLHSHDELREHSGTQSDSAGPVAAGFIHTNGKDALWSAESNIALRGLSRVLKDYSKTVGWDWGGLVGGDGQPIHDDLGAKQSYWYGWTDEVQIGKRPFKGSLGVIEVLGRTARVAALSSDAIREGLQEWATDFGYRLAEYPGGTNMLDRMKNWEHLDGFDKGNPEAEPQPAEDEGKPQGPFTCNKCGEVSRDFDDYRLHARTHEDQTIEPLEDGHFPPLDDMDDPLPLRIRNVKPTAMPLASFREASELGAFKLYSSVWDFANDDSKVFYGAYLEGKLQGYAVVREDDEPEVMMIYAAVPHREIGSCLMEKIQQHYPRFYSHANTKQGQRLLEKYGAVNISGQLYKWAAGQEPKDLIQAPVPFVYDIEQDHIVTGHPGMKTSDIMGNWTPSGIVEGYYEPGGKVVINTTTNMPYSTFHLLQLWYYQHPNMEITSLELEDPKGEKNTKLAGESVGAYLRTLTATDAAAWSAYQALRKAGGKVYVVGGAVRDALLQQEPKDIDLMVAGIPTEEVDQILSSLPGRVDLTGKRFGVYRYRTKGQEVEVALPRLDSYEGADRRAQGEITVDHTLPVEQDLLRRDFTANSMAVDLDNGKLVDPYGGSQDINAHVLRTTHPSSFSEDPTRLVRALVASSRHGLVPDEKTRQEMADNASRLDRESPDTLKPILDKLMASPNPAGAIRLAQETGILHHVFPELGNNFDYDQNNPHHKYTLGDHSLNVLDGVSKKSPDPDLRLAALLHDIGKPASAWVDPITGNNHYYPDIIDGQPVGADHAAVGAGMAEKRLREGFNYPVNKMARINALISNHMFNAFSTQRGARRFMAKVGEHANDLLTLREADMAGKGQTPEELAEKTKVEKMRSLVEGVQNSNQATDLSSLAINGNDLIGLGIKPGPQIGSILQRLMDAVIDNPQLNNSTDLLQMAKGYTNETTPPNSVQGPSFEGAVRWHQDTDRNDNGA